jgi:hypothetical protein
MKNTFHRDLEFGKRWEETAIDKLSSENSVIERPVGCHKEYDFILDGISYEVKSDKRAYSTGNLCIEYKRASGALSGISTTTAEYYIYFVVKPGGGYDVYKITVSYIKKLIQQKQYHTVYTNWDGATFYLFRSELFLFHRWA